MAKKMKQFNALPKFGHEICPVYLRLPWLGSASALFKSKLNLLPNSAFPLWNHVLFTLPTSFSLLPTRMYCLLYKKATWFIISHATVNSRYVGPTSQRLQDRIKQHIPESIRSCSSSQKRLISACRCKSSTQSLASDSAIGPYLLQNPVLSMMMTVDFLFLSKFFFRFSISCPKWQ